MSDQTATPSGPEEHSVGHTSGLRALDPLMGTWQLDGAGLGGRVRYELMDGGGFVVQTINLVNGEDVTKGVEYIGHDQESGRLRSHFFGASGEILEYVYDLSGLTLTIWFGDVDSPAKFVGTFDATYTRNTGRWSWPGGGYESNMTRVEGAAP